MQEDHHATPAASRQMVSFADSDADSVLSRANHGGVHHRGRGLSKCSPEFLRLHAIVKEQLRSHERFVINPRTSRWLPYWDGCLTSCLLFTALVSPIEVCLFKDTSSFVMLYIANRFVDSCFLLDLCICFFKGYQESSQKGGAWVTKLQLIRRNYLRTWFVVDLSASIPFDLLTSTGAIQGEQSTLLRLVRSIRLLRLVKLIRLLRASPIVAKIKSELGLSYATTSMLKFFTATFFMVHLMACAWAYIGLNWVASEGLTLPWETAWIDKYHFTGSSTARLYSISLYVAVVAMFGGVGSLSPANYAEYVLYTGMSEDYYRIRTRTPLLHPLAASPCCSPLLQALAAGSCCRLLLTRLCSNLDPGSALRLDGVGVGDWFALWHPCDAQPARHGLSEHHGEFSRAFNALAYFDRERSAC